MITSILSAVIHIIFALLLYITSGYRLYDIAGAALSNIRLAPLILAMNCSKIHEQRAVVFLELMEALDISNISNISNIS
jgi:hypothetical protein